MRETLLNEIIAKNISIRHFTLCLSSIFIKLDMV